VTAQLSETISLMVMTADLEVVRQQIPEIAAQLEVQVDQVTFRARRPLPSCLMKVALTGAPDRISDFQEQFRPAISWVRLIWFQKA
jgi:hypothetical protein